MPFTGIEMPAFDPAQPVGKRFSVYRWRVPSPSKRITGRGFYLASGTHGVPKCDARGSSFRLRLAWADDFMPRGDSLHGVAYYTDNDGSGDLMRPIVARLAHGRGYLPGWTLGEGMASTLDYSTIYDDARDAARAAHSLAENDAEREREYQERERERIQAEERAEDLRKMTHKAGDDLETMVDTFGLSAVLVMLSEVCAHKAHYLRETWNDEADAKVWDTLSRRTDKLASDARARGLSHND